MITVYNIDKGLKQYIYTSRPKYYIRNRKATKPYIETARFESISKTVSYFTHADINLD